MREEKKLITKEYVDRLSNSPYFIVVNYEGLKVDEFEELRDRLANSKAELHVVKNSILESEVIWFLLWFFNVFPRAFTFLPFRFFAWLSNRRLMRSVWHSYIHRLDVNTFFLSLYP